MDRFRVDRVWVNHKKHYIVTDYRTMEELTIPMKDRSAAEAIANGYNSINMPVRPATKEN